MDRRSAAVIGAGVTGLTTAYRLAQAGWACDVYERWPGLGGQAATLDVGRGHRLERYYHHLFTTDEHIAGLYRELGMPDEIEWRPSSVAIYSGGRVRPFTTPLDLLRYDPLSPLARLRMGAAVVWLGLRHRDARSVEQLSAREWVERAMGRQAWEHVWGPLLRAKFGARGDEISMAWLWSKLTLRRRIRGQEARQEMLGYPRRSWETLYEALVAAIEAAGGRVMIDRPAARIGRDGDGRLTVTPGVPDSFRRGHDPRSFEPADEPESYDGVVATVPSDVFGQLLDPELAATLGDGYLRRVEEAEYQTALCVLLEIDRSFSDSYYWTNIADPELPFIGLIEHTNFVDPERYGGRRFLYVANYVEAGDPLLELSADELIAAYEPGMRRINPAFDRSWIREAWRFAEPAAQPVVTVGYSDRIPALETGVPGLVLANTTQIYPEDRGTNYSVRLGGEAADALRASAAGGRTTPSLPAAPPSRR